MTGDSLSNETSPRPLLVLLHELGGSAASWTHVTRHLGDVDVLAVDFPGSGQRHDTLIEPRIEHYANDVIAILQNGLWNGAHRDTYIVGIAFGAAVGAAIAAREPAYVRGLGYVAMAPYLRDDTVRYVDTRNENVRRRGMAAVAKKSLRVTYPGRYRLASPVRFRDYRRAFLRHDPEAFARASAALAAEGQDLESTLRSLQCALHVLACTDDMHFAIQEIREVAKLAPQAGSFAVLRSGHFPHLQRPRAMAHFCRRVISESSRDAPQ